MADFESLALEGGLGLLQGNVRRAVDKLRGEIDAKTDGSYTPTAGVFSDPQPTTLAEALERIAAAVGTPIA